MLRAQLVRAGVELAERNIWEDPDAAAFVRSVARGNETVPTVLVSGVPLVNPTRDEVLALSNGEVPVAARPARLLRRLLGGRS